MKRVSRSPFHWLAAALSLHLLTFGIVQTVSAAVITTDQFVGADSRAASEARLTQFLTRDDVRAQLEALGVDPADASARVAALTAEELAQLDQRISEMPAGGVVAVIGVVFIVLLILELVGVTNIFTKF